MLKHEININDYKSSKTLNVTSILLDESYVDDNNMSINNRVFVYYDDNDALIEDGGKIRVKHKAVTDNASYDRVKKVEYTIKGKTSGCFVFLSKKYDEIKITNTGVYIEDNVDCFYLYLDESLFGADETVSFIFKRYVDNNWIVCEANFKRQFANTYYCAAQDLIYLANYSEVIGNWLNFEYYEAENRQETGDIIWEEVTEVPLTPTIEDFNFIKCGEKYYIKRYNGFDTNNLVVLKTSSCFRENDDFEIVAERVLSVIPVEIGNTFFPSVDKNENIDEYFVKESIRNNLSYSEDFEKTMYTPYKKIVVGGEKTMYKVKEIRFNFHFRQRSENGWNMVDNNSLWNGCYWGNDNNGYNIVKLMHNIGEVDDNNNQVTNQFFSFTDKSSQSDLLYFLGFTNADVMYQKKSLGKTFIRLSFYDSDDPTTQNLLCYQTLFYDTNELFSKKVKNDGKASFVRVNNGYSNKTNYVGFKKLNVNVEPLLDSATNDDDKEDMRLSSRITVRRRNTSKKSSEGFYIYMWKEKEKDKVPKDLYMKVEFNHAGYGRKTMFMMPYDEEGNIKTFENIVGDWNDGGYSLKRVLKYTYIRLKYCYDEEIGDHVYFVDDMFYNLADDVDNGIINFNLFEFNSEL